MSKNAYITLDSIGSKTGGGIVTKKESQALEQLGATTVYSRDNLNLESYEQPDSPFCQDAIVNSIVRQSNETYALAHFYAGCFSRTIQTLKTKGTKIVYTAAAHDLKESIAEFGNMGYSYPFKHMSNPTLFREYVDGYLNADLVVCPSNHSFKVMEAFGCKNIVSIPHGVDTDKPETQPPSKFIVGYLGQCGPDKGIIYLLQAWKKLNNPNAILVFAGRQSPELLPLIRAYGGGNIQIKGWVENTDSFYRECTVYCQPSVTEGFGIEVLEAMSNARAVICSSGAGASDCVSNGVNGFIVPPRSVDSLVECFSFFIKNPWAAQTYGSMAHLEAKKYSWDKVQKHYQDEWRKIV